MRNTRFVYEIGEIVSSVLTDDLVSRAISCQDHCFGQKHSIAPLQPGQKSAIGVPKVSLPVYGYAQWLSSSVFVFSLVFSFHRKVKEAFAPRTAGDSFEEIYGRNMSLILSNSSEVNGKELWAEEQKCGIWHTGGRSRTNSPK